MDHFYSIVDGLECHFGLRIQSGTDSGVAEWTGRGFDTRLAVAFQDARSAHAHKSVKAEASREQREQEKYP